MLHKRHRQVYLCKFKTNLVYIERSGAARSKALSKIKKGKKKKVHILESEMLPSGMYLTDTVTSAESETHAMALTKFSL